MRTSMSLAVAVAAGLAATMLSLAPAAPVRAVSTEAVGAPDVPAVRRADPPGTTYLYRGTFTAEVAHFLSVDWGDGDLDDRAVGATIHGTLPRLRADDLDLTSLRAGTVRVSDPRGTGLVRANSGRYEQTCTVTSGRIAGRPFVVPSRERAANGLTPFALLTLPASCTDTDGQASTRTYQYGPLVTDVQDVVYGARRLELPFSAERGLPPLTGADTCPGYIPGQTEVCTYEVTGTLTLELIRKVPPPQPRTASLAPGARSASAGVRCPERCTVTIRVTPLTGGPPVAARRFAPAPGRVTRLTVPIPPSQRARVRRSGGVRMHLAYRLTDGTRWTETRAARE